VLLCFAIGPRRRPRCGHPRLRPPRPGVSSSLGTMVRDKRG
jgi:hypothetical protein